MDQIVSARIRSQRWYTRFPRAVPIAIFALVFTVAGFSVYGIERVDAERTRTQLHAVAAGVSSALERRAISHVTYLRAGAMLMSASPHVTAASFHELAWGMADGDDSHNVAGITWAPRVANRDVAAFQAARRAEGLNGYTVHPAPPAAADTRPGRSFVVPVTYVSNPGAGPNVAQGFDMASDPQRRAAMAQAAHDRRPIATGKVALVDRRMGHWAGILIYMPVYMGPDRAGKLAGGQLAGFLCSPFNGQSFLGAALASVSVRGFGVRLYDGAARPEHLLAQVPGIAHPDLTVAEPLTIADRHLLLVVDGRGHGILSTLSVLTLLFALLVAILLTVLAQVVTRQAEEDRESLDWLEEQVSIRNTLTSRTQSPGQEYAGQCPVDHRPDAAARHPARRFRRQPDRADHGAVGHP